MVRSSKSRQAFWSAWCPVRTKLVMLLRGYNRVLGTQLCLPELSSSSESGKVKELKEVLSAPIERKYCCWTRQLCRLSRFQRMSVSMSLFLFRKVLPSESPSIPDFLDRISQPSDEPDREFLEFAGGLVDQIFPIGWDKGYDDKVRLGSVGTSSCEEGGCTRELYLQKYGRSGGARETFQRVCRGDPNFEFEPVKARMKSVFTAGKHRIVSIPQADLHHLRPLHHLLYDHLCSQGWMLRGDALPKRFDGKSAPFVKKDGEVFVSGDYEGATDNLNNHVQRFLLERVLSRCTSVPETIRNYAVASLSPLLAYDGMEVVMRSGQMMGFLLSFPLLCLINYVTFKYFVRRKVPVKINGDDIVFRSTRGEFDRWAAGVSRAGLKLSAGKTMVSASYFSLNSCLFKGRRGQGTKQVPFIRSKALFGVEDSKISPLFSLRGRLTSFCVGFEDAARDVWMELFLKCNRGYIKKSKCSISRGLGVPMKKSVLQSANLWDRECAYLELPREKLPPPPFSVWSHPPEGYEIALSEVKHKYSADEKDLLSEAFCAAAWKPAKPEKELEKEMGIQIPVLDSKKFSRLARITFSEVRSILSSRRDAIYRRYLDSRVRRYQYWRPILNVRDTSGPPGVHQETGEECVEVEGRYRFCPPPVVLYGMAAAEGYKPQLSVESLKRRRAHVIPFAESVDPRDPSGCRVDRSDFNDVALLFS